MIVKLELPVSMTASNLTAIIRGEGQALHPLVYWLYETVPSNKRTRQGGRILYEIDLPRAQLTRELADYMIGLNGDIEGRPFFFEIDLDARIAARLREEPDGVVDRRKWSEWFATSRNRKPLQINDKYYIGTNVFGEDYLPAKTAIQWATNTSTTLIAITDLPKQQEPTEPTE
jgi:hypothetical protein